MSETVVGVDLGGTNVRAQAFSADGSPFSERVSVPSRAQEGVSATVEAVIAAVLACSSSPAAVGMAVPGHIRADTGTVVWAPNFGRETPAGFEYWKDVPLGPQVAEGTGARVVLGNDANCAALGEYRFGSGRAKASCLVMLTVGTGIGGGVVLGPQSLWGGADRPVVLVGGNQGGAELGHLCLVRGGVECNAGSYGALEAYCQRDAIIARARHKLRRGRESIVREMVQGDLGHVTPEILSQAAEMDDVAAIEVWEEVGGYLGAGIGSLINVFAPEVFAIGGQISKAGKWLLEPAIQEARNVAIPSLFADCQIVRAEQVDDAGILGAAALVISG
ncbi:MAG: ROK family protein [Fimbriimonadaceae bacterium]